MKLKKIFFLIVVCVFPAIVFADDIKRYYAVSEIGTTTYAASSYTLTGNSWNIGLGYEVDSLSAELLIGSAFRLRETYGASSYDYSFTTTSLFLNYKIINSGNFRPFIGIGSVSGTRTIEVNGATTYSDSGSRFVYDLGLEVPLDDNSSIRFKYISTTPQVGYADYSSANIGLLFRF